MTLIPDFVPSFTRPIRLPPPLRLPPAEPAFAIAGRMGSWTLPLVLEKDVSADSMLKLQLFGGRNNKGAFTDAQCADPRAPGYVSVCLMGGKSMVLKPGDGAGTLVVSVPPGGLRAGARLTAVLGDTVGGSPGLTPCDSRHLDKFCLLYAIPSGEGEQSSPRWAGGSVWTEDNRDTIVAACVMHILGGPIAQLRAYIPSQVKPGETLDVLVRPEDSFSNLSCFHIGDLAVWLAGTEIPSQLVTVPGSTCVRATVKIEKEGVHRLRVVDRCTGVETTTNPTVCRLVPAGTPVLWGMIHGHTEMSDGTGSLDNYFHQIRDEAGLDFAATSDHDHLWETSEQMWRVTCEKVKQWYTPGEFVPFLGYEWAKWRKNGDGDRNVYYLADDRPIYRSDDGEYPSPPDLFRKLREEDETAIVIPHHPGHAGNFCDYKDHDPRFERLVEIFQTRGSYECPEQDGNPAPERNMAEPPYDDGMVSRALAMGWRVGFTAGGDDHDGQAGTDHPLPGIPPGYKAGLMSVTALGRTRPAIWDALHERRVVATTGPRILLAYTLNDRPMGSELAASEDPALLTRRHISVEAHGTAPIDKLDIIRCNKVAHSVPGDGRLDMLVDWTDAVPLADVCLPPAEYCNHPFAYYYVRVVQTDGEVAWASPVWVDL